MADRHSNEGLGRCATVSAYPWAQNSPDTTITRLVARGARGAGRFTPQLRGCRGAGRAQHRYPHARVSPHPQRRLFSDKPPSDLPMFGQQGR